MKQPSVLVYFRRDDPYHQNSAIEAGRSFYAALGHPDTCFRDERYLRHIAGGIMYAMGMAEG